MAREELDEALEKYNGAGEAEGRAARRFNDAMDEQVEKRERLRLIGQVVEEKEVR